MEGQVDFYKDYKKLCGERLKRFIANEEVEKLKLGKLTIEVSKNGTDEEKEALFLLSYIKFKESLSPKTDVNDRTAIRAVTYLKNTNSELYKQFKKDRELRLNAYRIELIGKENLEVVVPDYKTARLEYSKKLINALENLRKEKGFSLKEFAQILGLTYQGYFRYYAKKVTYIKPKTLEKFLKGLNMTEEELLSYGNNK